MHSPTPSPIGLYLAYKNHHVDCGPGPTNFTSEITVEAWICLYETSGVVVSQRGSLNDGYVMSVSSKGLSIEFANGAEKACLDTSNAAGVAIDDKWHHLAFTLKDKTLSAYVDGIARGTTTFNSPIRLHAQTLYFGRDAQNINPLRGVIAEVRIWNKARTQNEIVDAMNYRLDPAVVGSTTGLVGYWPLAGTPQDMSGQGHHGVKQGGQWTEDSSLPVFKRDQPLAIYNPHGENHAQCATAPATRFDALTVEAWVQTPGECDGSIVQWAGPQDTPKFSLAVSKHDLVITLAQSAQDQFELTVPLALIYHRWHHVALVWSTSWGRVTAYIDGVAKATSGNFAFASALNFTAGTIRLNPGELHVADVRIWNTARQPAELLATRETRLRGNEPNLIAYWRLDQPGRTIKEQTAKIPDATFVGQGVCWIAAPDLPLEEASIANAVLSFSDKADHVECLLNTATMTNALTVEAWIRIQNMSGIVVAQGSMGQGVTGYELSVSPNTLSVWVRGGTHMQLVTMSAPVPSLVGSWHHVAFTLLENTVTTYIDGLAYEKKLSIDIAHENLGSDLYIGCHSQLRNIFKGEIAEVRVWSICRSAQQINAARFTRLSGGEAGLVAYFPLSEGTGLSISERVNAIPVALQGPTWKSEPSLPLAPASYRNHARLPAATTIAPATPATSAATHSAWLEFDGNADYLDCGAIDFARGSYTIEAWIKTQSDAAILAATLNNQHGLYFAPGRYVHRYPVAPVGGATLLFSNDRIRDDKWHHVAVVRTESTITVYLDGVREKSMTGRTNNFSEAPLLQVGRRVPYASQLNFKGGIRDLRIWSTARSDAEIAHAFHRRLLGTEPGLVAYWPLDEGEDIQGANGNMLLDRTGKHTATIHGAKWVSASDQADTTPALQTPDVVVANDDPVQSDAVIALAAAGSQTFSAAELSNISTENLDPSLKKLIDEVKQSKDGDALTLDNTSFSEFNLFKSLDGFLVNTLGIRDFKLTLLGVAQREAGEADAATPAQPKDAAQASAAPGKKLGGEVGLNITGKVDLLGLSSADITIEFVIKSDKSKATFVKIEGGNVLKDAKALLAGALPAGVASVLDILGALAISNPTVAFATEDFDDIVPPYNLGVRPGLNLYGTLTTGQFDNANTRTFGKALKFVAALFGLDALTMRVVLHKSSTGMELALDSVVEQDIAFLKGDSFSLTYKGLGLHLSVRGTPPEPALTIANQLVLTLEYIGAEDLLLTGSLTGEAESFSAAFALQTPEDKPWHPFNFSQLSVGALALKVGGTYTKPFIDNLGLAAQNITIGKGDDAVKGSLSILIDFNDPDQFVLVIETPGITLLQLISCFSLPTLLAYQALPSGVTAALNKIVNVKLTGPSEGENAKISIVPAPTQIGPLVYDEEGIHVKGKIVLWGWSAMTSISISPESVDMLAVLEPINIRIQGIDIFSVRGAGDSEKPAFRLYLGSEETPQFFMALSVTLLMMRSAVFARLDASGLRFTLERSLGPLHTSLSVLANSTGTEASGSTTFSLNLSIPILGLGSIRLVDVNFVAATELKVAQSFALKLAGTLNFYGKSFAINLTFDQPFADFESLFEKVVAYLLESAKDIFGAIWNTFEAWGQAVADGVIYLSDSVASVAKNVYNLGSDQMHRIIQVSQVVGDGAVTIASGMKSVYAYSDKQAAQALKTAGYAAGEVVNALTIAYQVSATSIVAALSAAGYGAEAIFAGLTAALVNLNGLIAEDFAGALKAAGYAVEEIARALKASYQLAEKVMLSTLKVAKYGVEEIAKGLKAAYALTADATLGFLKGAWYGVVDVANGLKAAYALAADQIIPVLFRASYILKDVGIVLKDAYKLAEDQAVMVLEQASAVVDLATGVAKSAAQVVAGKATVISDLAHSAVVPITRVLKDVYLCGGESAAKALKAGGKYAASGVAQGLKEVFQFSASQTANALKGVGYVANETTIALQKIHQATALEAAQMLKAVGYIVEDVANCLKVNYFWTSGVKIAADTAAVLTAAAYAVKEVAQGLKIAFNLTGDAAAGILKGAGYAVVEIARCLKDVYNLAGDAAARALKGAKYVAGEIAQGLKDAYGMSGELAADVLKGAGYSAKEVGDALHSTYNFTLDQTKKALNGVGFAASDLFDIIF